MKTVIMRVTPAQARTWLEQVPEVQRPLNLAMVQKYANDMRKGFWKLTHQGIAIDSRNRVVDGQHRLHAISLADVAVEMMVVFDAPPASFDHIDMGYTRHAADIMKIRGIALGTKENIAIVRQIETGHAPVHDRSLSPDELQRMLERHRAALEFVATRFSASKSRRPPAPVIGAVCLAWYYEGDKERLATFCDILKDGMPRNMTDDRTAVAFKAFLAERATLIGPGKGNSVRRSRLFLVTQRAVKAHMDREYLSKFYTPSAPIYPPLT